MGFAAASAAVVALLALLTPVSVSAGTVALACAQYDTTVTPVEINYTQSGILQPTSVKVDTGEWVFFASNSVSKIVRYASATVTPTFQVIGASASFLTISGLCLSPKDQSLFVTDSENNTLTVIPCLNVGEPKNPRSGPFCTNYASYHLVYSVPLNQPSRCAVDKANNIYITQGSNQVIMVNSSNFSYSTITVPGAMALSPVAVDLTEYDVYFGDSSQAKLFRLPCTKIDAKGTQCLSFGTVTNPSALPVVIQSTSGLALNRGEGSGDFDLIISDYKSSQIVSISHPKSTQSSGTLLLALPAQNAPYDIALDPIRFDIVVAEPEFSLPTHGSLVRLPCATEVYAPSPAVSTTTTTTPAPAAPSGMSPGSVFLLILFLLVLVYFGGGAIFKRVSTQRWVIPNEQMWRNFGGLVTDGFYFAFCCGKKPGPHVPYDGGKVKTTGAHEGTGPQYDRYDAVEDDL
jgi:hypothetical protein